MRITWRDLEPEPEEPESQDVEACIAWEISQHEKFQLRFWGKEGTYD
jgi:hypothetical protein